MFESARLKLTLWYLLIIMAVSLSFSAVIYKGITNEFRTRLNVIEDRFGTERFREKTIKHILAEDLETVQKSVLIILFYTNGVILIISAGAGYFLAGKTLRPIEETLKEQKRFIADASHELKTPITALKTSIEVTLRDKKLNKSRAVSALKDSLGDINSLQALTNNLLSLARVQDNNESFKFKKVDLSSVVKFSAKNLAPQAKERDIKIVNNLEKVYVKADIQSMKKLTSILLDNAIKYSKKGKEISITVGSARKTAILSITDQGMGISKKDQKHVFDRFYQANQSRSKGNGEGFGLGLCIAKQIVEIHNGNIELQSKKGVGTTFTVKLPLA